MLAVRCCLECVLLAEALVFGVKAIRTVAGCLPACCCNAGDVQSCDATRGLLPACHVICRPPHFKGKYCFDFW